MPLQIDEKGLAASGYSPDEIASVRKQIQSAQEGGYSDQEIMAELARQEQQHRDSNAWGPGQEALEGASLGAYIPARAAVGAGVMPGTEVDPAFANLAGRSNQSGGAAADLSSIPARAAALNAQRDAYGEEHPVASTGIGLATSAAPLLAANALVPEVAVPAAIAKYAPGAARMAGRLATGGLEGAAAGAESSGLNDAGLGQNVETGALIGPLARGAGLLMEPKINSGVRDAAIAAQDQGVGLRPLQIAQSKGLNKLDSSLSSGSDEQQYSNFMSALGRKFGIDSPVWNQATVNQAEDNVKAELNSAAANTRLTPADPAWKQAIAQVRSSMNGLGADDRKTLNNVINTVNGSTEGGYIDGKTYQTLTNMGGELGSLSKHSNSTVRQLGGVLRDGLDAAAFNGTPDEYKNAFAFARDKYKSLGVLSDLADEAGPSGVIDPKAFARKAIARGYTNPQDGDFGTLAAAGKFLSKPTAQGGTSAHGGLPSWMRLPAAVGVGGLGASAVEHGLANVDPYHAGAAAVAAGAGLGAKRALGGYLASSRYADRILNDKASFNPLVPLGTEWVNGLMGPPGGK